MTRTFASLLLLLCMARSSGAQTWLSYLEKPKLSGIHVYQDSTTKICTVVAGSDALVPSPTFIYQIDSNYNIVAAKQIESYGKNITSAAASNATRTIVSRSVQLGTGQITANLICFDRQLNLQWSTMLESNYITHVNAVRITKSGHTYVVGNGITPPPSKDYSFLCKLSPKGYKMWELTDYTRADTTAFWRLALDDRDNTYAIGKLGPKGLLTKVSPSGETEWQHSVFFKGETRLSAIAVGQGFIYILGEDEGSRTEEGQVFISKITTEGKEVWTTLLSTKSHRFLLNHAAIKTLENGELMVTLSCVDAGRKRSWATIDLDPSGVVLRSANYQDHTHESFPRDLFLGKNATVAAVGTLVMTGQSDIYPLFFKSSWPNLLQGQCCFTPLAINQKKVPLELLPARVDFIDYVAINFSDFQLVAKNDTGVIKRLKN